MTNVYATADKVRLRRQLFQVGLDALKKEGWQVERVQGAGKSSLRRITKGPDSKLVSIRTTQDTWIAFPRTRRDDGWVTLSEADFVVAVSVDDADDPRFAQAHLIDGDEMRDRFDRAYRARLDAGHSIPLGRGVWVSLYLQEVNDPVNRVGAGAGLAHPAILRVPLDGQRADISDDEVEDAEDASFDNGRDDSLTIAEAKRRLALTFGVDPASVKITIEA
jgi:hypothetical protein